MMTHDFFTGNRHRLYTQLKPHSFAVFTAFTRVQGDNDAAAPFRQEGNFWYLTGIEEADWRLVADIDSGEEWLVAPHVDFIHRMFDGGLSPEQAARLSGIKQIIDKREGSALLKKLAASKQIAYTISPEDMRRFGFVPNPALRRLATQLKKDVAVADVRLPLAKMRAIKQPAEITALQKAVTVTIEGIEAILAQLKHLQYEYEADAILTSVFRRQGAVHAFEPIIGAGKNTCVLHHPLPKDPLVQNDWLLLDVGARVDGYSADISRTIPIGKPSPRHLAVYEAVQRMHDYTFDMLKSGTPVREFMHKAYHNVGEELKRLGLIAEIKLDETAVFKYMPHAIGHGLGVDVHDALGKPEIFAENMVLTVEVGCYIVDQGIGVRLEDDVLITKDGATNMSKQVPIELEKLRKMIY